LIGELQALMKSPLLPEPRLFITDTLGNPFIEDETLGQLYEPVAKSRRDANRVKKEQPITVVIGNPPYKERAEGRGSWIESGSGGKLTAPLDRWKPPPEWGVGAHAKHLKNLYIYFWRWATWKVFGSGNYAATGFPDKDEEGIVCFITVAGFLNGPGFEKMRDDLRRTCSEIWVIDCSPEGHQPEVATRIFQGVQQPVCIVLAARKLGKSAEEAARVRFHALPDGQREKKFTALAALSLQTHDWINCPSGWRDPFLPSPTGAWAGFPMLEDLFLYNGSGVMPGRTWVIAPDSDSLVARWSRLVKEKDNFQKEILFHPQLRKGKVASRHIRKIVKQDLGSKQTRSLAIIEDNGACESLERYGFRSFDRQWLIGDARLLNDVRPVLWNAHSHRQVYLTALEAHSPSSGPAVTFTGLVPDLHHYKGSFGGRAYPLWRDRIGTQPNIKHALLAYLAKTYGQPVKAEDVMAYIAAVMAHPAFTARFQSDLLQPGLRVPITADAKLFAEAVALGSEVIWLHCYGERFIHASANRPKQAPRLPTGNVPIIPVGGASRPDRNLCRMPWIMIRQRGG
jgi:predicted helicase